MIVASLGAVPLAAHYVCMNLMDIFYYFAMGLGFAGASHTDRVLVINDQILHVFMVKPVPESDWSWAL